MSRIPDTGLRIALPLVLASFISVAWAAAETPEALLEKYRCTICHSEREVAAGPPWIDVASKYRREPHADKLVAGRIRDGVRGGGPWHMPPHPEISAEDARIMARYILATGTQAR